MHVYTRLILLTIQSGKVNYYLETTNFSVNKTVQVSDRSKQKGQSKI